MPDLRSSVLAWHRTRKGADMARDLVSASPLAKMLGQEDSAEEFLRKASSMKPDILLVEYDEGNSGAAELLQHLSRVYARGSVVALASSQEPEAILSAMRLGVSEYLTEPVPAQAFNDAILRLARHAQMASQPQGILTAVMGVKGGVGTSSLAVSLAWGASRQFGTKVALVDMDFSAGDLAYLLDFNPSRDISDVAGNFDRLDGLYLDSLLAGVSPGLNLLASPVDPVAAEDIRAEHVERVLDHLLDSHGMVVADLPSRLCEASLLALDRADEVLLVLEPTVVCLKSAQRLFELGDRLWKQPEKLRLVINRAGAKGCLKTKEVERALSQEIFAVLPDDTRTVMEAANAGSPALRDMPRSRWAKAVKQLTQDLARSEEP